MLIFGVPLVLFIWWMDLSKQTENDPGPVTEQQTPFDEYDHCKAVTYLNSRCDGPGMSQNPVCIQAMREYHICLKKHSG